MSFIGAACTEWLGIHAIFGSFLVGIAIGDSVHLREQTRSILSQFISFSFAPIFFAGIGLRVNFYEHFDPLLAIAVILIACAGKVMGCMFGARLGGMSPRESWAVGFGMNARGAMEIILGLTALQQGLIDERMFVALVIMAIVTSMLSGPMMRWLLRLKRPPELGDLLNPKGFLGHISAWTRSQAIELLSAAAAKAGNLEPRIVALAVLEREAIMPTGIGHGIAIPHARIEGLARPVVAIGMSHDGVDFNAPDGEPARLMFLVLTDVADGGTQVSILADIARKFGREDLRRAALDVDGYTQFMALLRTASPPA
jgi:mannitol/fructose-specific phosphotransferase system IIA component (Ntr-type)